MHFWFWRPSLSGRVAPKKLVAGAMMLALLVSALTTNLFFARPAAAATAPTQPHTTTISLRAQDVAVQSLNIFGVWQDVIYNKFSYDNGASWSGGFAPPPPTGTGFVGTPAVVSEGDGYLRVFARNTQGLVYYNHYSGLGNSWDPSWTLLPGITAPPGHVPVFVTVTNSSELWLVNSDPAVTSWGPGRLDVFMVAQDANTGGFGLLHTWADNNTWANRWELLDPGNLRGNPTAVSWGPGRLDVFVRGGIDEVEHKWFANGSWSRGWENLGGVLTSNPTTTSLGSGRLDIFGRGTDGHVWDKWFSSGGWSSWVDRGCCLAGDIASSVSVTSPAPGTLSLVVIGTDHALYRKPFTDGVGYGDWQFIDHLVDYTTVTAVAWTFAGIS